VDQGKGPEFKPQYHKKKKKKRKKKLPTLQVYCEDFFTMLCAVQALV
jgi:hypothetical protein